MNGETSDTFRDAELRWGCPDGKSNSEHQQKVVAAQGLEPLRRVSANFTKRPW
jgi:hypothetical protein